MTGLVDYIDYGIMEFIPYRTQPVIKAFQTYIFFLMSSEL